MTQASSVRVPRALTTRTKGTTLTLAAGSPATPVSTDRFRSIMGTVCAQVAVITTVTEHGRLHGTTVTAFAALSLEPPMVSVALDRSSRLLAGARQSGRVGITLLADGQDDLALHFASKADDKFETVAWHLHSGLPRLDGAAGWLGCEVRELVDGGDHVVLFCLVHDVETSEQRPLVYGHRRFGTHSGLLASL